MNRTWRVVMFLIVFMLIGFSVIATVNQTHDKSVSEVVFETVSTFVERILPRSAKQQFSNEGYHQGVSISDIMP